MGFPIGFDGADSEGESLVIPQDPDVANLQSGYRREALRKAPKQVYLGIHNEILSPLFFSPRTTFLYVMDPMNVTNAVYCDDYIISWRKSKLQRLLLLYIGVSTVSNCQLGLLTP